MITQSVAIERLHSMSNTAGSPVEDTDWNTAINYALRELRSKFSLPWAQRTTQLLVYPNVTKYAAPSDMSHPKVPQRYLTSDHDDDAYFVGTTARQFARNRDKIQNDFAVSWDRTTQYLLIRYGTDASESLLHNCDTVGDNGTWAGGGDASAAATDTGTLLEGAGSVRFTVTNSSGSATLTNSTMSSVDLTDFQNRSRAFFYLDVPVSGLTTVALRWGSSASDYWEVTGVTTQHHGAGIESGDWNLFSFNWTSAITSSGSPSVTAVNYVRVTLTAAGTSTNYHLDHVVFRRYDQLQLPYYSKNLVLSGATYQEEVSGSSDQIVGDTDWDNLILNMACNYAAKYILKDADLVALTNGEIKTLTGKLESRYPREDKKTSVQYYPLNRL